jgi:hypothetical protein
VQLAQKIFLFFKKITSAFDSFLSEKSAAGEKDFLSFSKNAPQVRPAASDCLGAARTKNISIF